MPHRLLEETFRFFIETQLTALRNGGCHFSNNTLTWIELKLCYIVFMSRKRINTGIYCIENTINGKKYIGQAYNIERRLYEHKYHLKRGTDHSGFLQRAVNKYGIGNFNFYVLETCETDQMNEREIYWISYYQTNNKDCGYNLSRGGEKSLLGYKFPPEFGRKISMVKKGTKLSEETKRKISIAQKGKILSEETKRRISAGRSGEKHYFWGKHYTEDEKKKLSLAHGGEKAWQLGKKNPNSASKYYGLSRVVTKGHVYWSANITVYGKRTYLGASKDEIEAAKIYDAYIIANSLPNPLNFPEES
jgi:group I intron endonuclease